VHLGSIPFLDCCTLYFEVIISLFGEEALSAASKPSRPFHYIEDANIRRCLNDVRICRPNSGGEGYTTRLRDNLSFWCLPVAIRVRTCAFLQELP
jgi:hypothetical protein